MREVQRDGRRIGESARKGYARRRYPGRAGRPLGLGGTSRVDGTHGGGPRDGGERRQVVQPDGQGVRGADAPGGLGTGAAERRQRGRRPAEYSGLRGPGGALSWGTEGGAAAWDVSPRGGTTSVDPEAGQSRTATVGDSNGQRSGGANGTEAGAGADLGGRVRRAELWVSARARVQGCTAAGAGATGRRRHLGGGRGRTGVLRQHPARMADGGSGTARGRWGGAAIARGVPAPGGVGRTGAVAAGAGDTARGGHQSAAGEC